ncbi:MAG: hypothetical protein DHS20C18_11120 [Saprospiraceae bacterium]|nr:MAG: hypothetical protein DHS20C18_11120 [Saprospiraceae bacterium]
MLGFIIFCLAQSGYAQSKPERRIRLPDALSEVSGLYYASRDSLWWHNDSGDAPNLYLTDGEGHLLFTLELPQLRNVDWEDLTADDQGNLYIGDFGNNLRNRQDLKVYRVHLSSREVDSIAFQFPDWQSGKGLDTEAFFWHRDSLHLFTKSQIPKGNYYTKHYALADHGNQQVADFRDSIRLKRRAITGAAIDPNTGMVALVGYNYGFFLGLIPHSAASVFFLNQYPEGHYLQGTCRRRKISCLWGLQYESIDFVDKKYLYVAAEKTLWIKAKAKRKKRKKD